MSQREFDRPRCGAIFGMIAMPIATEVDDPVIEFWARIKGSDAHVKVLRRHVEWSLADHGGVTAIPMTSITAVSTAGGRRRSRLILQTDNGVVELSVDTTMAGEARAMIRLLMAVFGRVPEPFCPKVVGEAEVADELMNLRAGFDRGDIDYDEYEEQRARMLGF